jgi:hypothetical protein
VTASGKGAKKRKGSFLLATPPVAIAETDTYYGGMARGLRSRASWSICLMVIILAGIFSRVVHTGFVLFDKYLGDVLYAAMIYAILRLWRTSQVVVVWAMAVMVVIELIQLTMIAAHMLTSEHLIVRIIARLMGTHFSFLDLLAYVVGIGGVYLLDSSRACAATNREWN